MGEYLTPQGRNIFIAMEFIAGESLDAWQSKGDHHSAASLDECLRLYLQAAAGPAAAHASGLIHRDFKPSNVLIGQDGRVRVLTSVLRTLESHTLAVDEAKPIGTPANTQKSARSRGSPWWAAFWVRQGTWPPNSCWVRKSMRAAISSVSVQLCMKRFIIGCPTVVMIWMTTQTASFTPSCVRRQDTRAVEVPLCDKACAWQRTVD